MSEQPGKRERQVDVISVTAVPRPQERFEHRNNRVPTKWLIGLLVIAIVVLLIFDLSDDGKLNGAAWLLRIIGYFIRALA